MSNQKSKYFHENYFKKIIKLYEENRLEEAISEFEKYISIYPKDLCGYIYYADAWMKLGYFEEAEKLLNDASFVITEKTSEASKNEFTMFKIKLLCCQEKYRKCLKLLKNNIEVFRDNDWSFFGPLFYLKKKVGILEVRDYQRANERYLWSQIVSYDEEKAISHIERHMEYDKDDNTSKFNNDFPLRDIYFKLREMLPLEGGIYDNMIQNIYIFKYDSNGHVDSKLVDYFVVVALKDSNEIITMYPYENSEKRECIDLTPKTLEQPKVKRMSQIDKFNQRYGKKVDNN